MTVIRLPKNGGPSAARNAAIDRARGRYVLPVDADNLLLPDAVEKLVDQLSRRRGCRLHLSQPPVLRQPRRLLRGARLQPLHRCSEANFCDTCVAARPRASFDAGLRYPDDIVLGHEDWDFALSLADARRRGEPARAKTLLLPQDRLHPLRRGRVRPPSCSATVVRRAPPRAVRPHIDADQGRWAPALTIVPRHAARERGRAGAARLAPRSPADLEATSRSWPRAPESWPDHMEGPPVPAAPARPGSLADRGARARLVQSALR